MLRSLIYEVSQGIIWLYMYYIKKESLKKSEQRDCLIKMVLCLN